MNGHTDTILVVDDSPETLSFINDVLDGAGMDVLVALEGRQALKIAGQIRPDMILLDALMPTMDGFTTCRTLKADPQLAAIPVIFMTGLSDTQDIIRGLEAGGVDYITKPIAPAELLARMKVHLDNARHSHHAQAALDSTGQRLLTIDRLGRLTWATAQVRQWLEQAGIGERELQQIIAPQWASWLATEPAAEEQLVLDDLPAPLVVQYVAANPPAEHLLRLVDPGEPQGAERLHHRFGLTEREAEVLYLTAEGKTNREIAGQLHLSPRTINKHLEMIFPKLGVNNRTAAAAIAIKVLSRAD